jgi:hypothetical protein
MELAQTTEQSSGNLKPSKVVLKDKRSIDADQSLSLSKVVVSSSQTSIEVESILKKEGIE